MDSQELSKILENVKGKRATAVDVESEGPPPLEAEHAPINQERALPEPDSRSELPPIPEEAEEPAQPLPQQPPSRALAPSTPPPPVPTAPVRRESIQTVEEPLV